MLPVSGFGSNAGARASGQMARQMTVLLADSDQAARHVLRRVLQREFKSVVIEADNGLSALEGLDAGGVDAVVMDLRIPTLGGLEVLRDIRESPRHKVLPVVVVTEQRDEESIKEALALGVSDYVLKDQHQAVIVERLRRIFSSSRHRGPAQAQSRDAHWTSALSTAFSILVVDEDADFRHFCTDIFRTQYDVTTTASAAHAMTLCMAQPPNALLIGTTIGTMSQATFARRIRQMNLPDTRLIAVVPKTQVQAATGLGLFDRIAVRSFVPETFMRQFENFLKAPGVLSKVSAAIPGFRSQTISAVEQVFGMMMGTEVSILDAPPMAPPEGVSVAVPISLDEQRTDVVVAATVSHATGLALASRMLQSAEADLPDDAASSALAEILNMVGGRVQHGLTSNGIGAHIGLPALGAAVPLSPESIVLGFGFEGLDGVIREFSFSVSEQESTEKKNG